MKMHYYKRNLGDYAKKAGRLSMLQHGSYTLLIDACYDREQFPTLDEAIEWTWASSQQEIEAVEFVLRKFFVLENGIYVQKRIQEELADYSEKSDKNKRIAIERETKRKENNTIRAQSVNEPPPNHKPITNNQEPRTIKVKTIVPQAETLEVFEYWKLKMDYPNAKLDAKREKAIKSRIKDGYTIGQICQAIDGCKIDAFSQGLNDRKTKYDDIELICRDNPRLDKFMKIATLPPTNNRSANQQASLNALQDYAQRNGILL